MQSKKTKSASARGGGIRWAGGQNQDSARGLQAQGMAASARAPQECELLCRVVHMDGEEIDICCDKTAKGQVLFDKVMTELNVFEKDYFGLTYLDAEKKRNWLDNDKQVCKQCGKEKLVFFLEVRFFPPDPLVLKQEITPYLICLQIRNDIVNAKLPCSFSTQCLLGSYLAQSIFGDYDDFSMGPDYEYLAKFPMSPTLDWDMTEKVHELHQLHRGQTPTEAERHYLKNATKLSMYGVELHPALDSEDVIVNLGVCWNGLILFRGKLRIHRYPWSSILDVSAKRNLFQLKTKPGEFEQTENIIHFKLDTPEDVNRLWKRCIDNHAFYRLMTPANPNKEISSLIPGLGSSQYQYSGRTLYQASLASCMLEKKAPAFWRNPKQRVPILRDSGKRSWRPTHDATSECNLVPKRSVGFRDHQHSSLRGSSGNESESESFSKKQADLHNSTSINQDVSHIPKHTTSKTMDRDSTDLDNNDDLDVIYNQHHHHHNVENGTSNTISHLSCNIDANNHSNTYTTTITERHPEPEDMESEDHNVNNKFVDCAETILRDVSNNSNIFDENITKLNCDMENELYWDVENNEYGTQTYDENDNNHKYFLYKECDEPDYEIDNNIENKNRNNDNDAMLINNESNIDSENKQHIDKEAPECIIANILDNIETGLYKNDNFTRKVINNVPNISINDGCAKAVTKQNKLCEVKGFPTYNYQTYYNNKDDALEKECNHDKSKISTYCCCFRSQKSESLLGLNSEHAINVQPVTSTNSTHKFDFLRHESTKIVVQIHPMLVVFLQLTINEMDQPNSNLICETSTPEQFNSLNQPLIFSEKLSKEVMVANKSFEIASGLQNSVSDNLNMQPSTSDFDRNMNLICKTSTPEAFSSLNQPKRFNKELPEELIIENRSIDIESGLQDCVSDKLIMQPSTSHIDQTIEYKFHPISKESSQNAQFMPHYYTSATFEPSSFHEIKLDASLVRCQPIYESVDATVELCIYKPGVMPCVNDSRESNPSISETSNVSNFKGTISQPKTGIFNYCFSCNEKIDKSEQSSPVISNVREKTNKKKTNRTDWILGYPKYHSVPTKKMEVSRKQLKMKDRTCDVQKFSNKSKDVSETSNIESKPNYMNLPSEASLGSRHSETKVKPVPNFCTSNLEPLNEPDINVIPENIPVSSVELAQSTYDNVKDANLMSTSAKQNINISVIPQTSSRSILFSQTSYSHSESNTSISSNEADTKRRKLQFYATDKTTPSAQYKMIVSPIAENTTDRSEVIDTIRTCALDNSYSSNRSDGMSNSTASTASTVCERTVEQGTSKDQSTVSTKLPMHLCDVIEWPTPPEDDLSSSDPIDDKNSTISIGSESGVGFIDLTEFSQTVGLHKSSSLPS